MERRRGTQVETNCYYRGHVVGVADSSVTITTCTTSSNDRTSSNTSPRAPPSSSSTHFQTTSLSSNGNDIALTGVIALPGVAPLFIEPADAHAHQLSSCKYRLHLPTICLAIMHLRLICSLYGHMATVSNGDHVVYRLNDVKEEETSYCGVGREHEHTHDDHNDIHASPALV
jgi:hypothetical protein